MEMFPTRPCEILEVIGQMARDLKDSGCLDKASGTVSFKFDTQNYCAYLNISQRENWGVNSDLDTLMIFVKSTLSDKLGMKVALVRKFEKDNLYEKSTYTVSMKIEPT